MAYVEPGRLDLHHGADNVERGAGAKLMREGREEARRARLHMGAKLAVEPDQLDVIAGRIGEAIELDRLAGERRCPNWAYPIELLLQHSRNRVVTHERSRFASDS